MGDNKLICLVRIKSSQGERSHVITRSPFIIGRAQDSDIVVVDTTASRQHASIEFSEKGITIEDQSSANGTTVDSEPIDPKKKIPLTSHLDVRFGTSDETYYFQVLPRPLEYQDVDQQREALRQNMSEVIKGLQQFAKEQAIQEVKKEAEAQSKAMIASVKAQAEKDSANWAASQRQALEKQIKEDLAKHQAKLVEDANSQKEKLAEERKAHADEIEKARQAQSQAMAEIKLQMQTKMDQELIQAQSELLEKARKDALHVQHEIVAQHAKEIHDLNTMKEVLLNSKNIADTACQESQKRLRELQIRIDELQQQQTGMQTEIESKKLEYQDLNEKAIAAEKKWHLANKDGLAKLAELERETAAKGQNIIQEAERKADQILRKAQETADSINQASLIESANIRERSLQVSEQMIEESRKEAATLAESLRKSMEYQIDQERIQLQSRIRTETEKLQAGIIESHQTRVRELESLKNTLAKETSENSEKLKVLETDVQNLQGEKTKLQSLVLPLRGQLQQLSKELDFAQERVRQGNDAVQVLNLTTAELIDKRAQLSALNIDIEKQSAVLNELIKTKSERVLAAHQTEKRTLDTELERHKSQKISEIQAALPAMAEIEGAISGSVSGQGAKRPGWLKPAAVFMTLTIATLGTLYQKGLLHANFKREPAAQVETGPEIKVPTIFKPEQSTEFRGTYTDNVIFMKNYVAIKLSPDYQQLWAKRLEASDLRKTLGLSEDRLTRFQAQQNSLVFKLNDLRFKIESNSVKTGMARMQRLESEERMRMQEALLNKKNLAQIEILEKNFMLEYIKTHPNQISALSASVSSGSDAH